MFCRISEDHLSGPGSLSERLRALPAFTPPPGGWARLNHRRQQVRRRYAMAGGGLAMAASMLVAIVLFVVDPNPAPSNGFAGGGFAASQPAAQREVAQLISRSQNLERQLSSARPQVAVWDAGQDTRARMIEQRLRIVDAQLNATDDAATSARLWRERVKLMNALVDLHETNEPALQYASYQY